MEPAAVMKPTGRDERIDSLDVARGLALFGIFMVNVQMMVQPLAAVFAPGVKSEGVAEWLKFGTRVLFESKSYPLFSMLFGMGLVLMYDRARGAGRGFAGPYLRRLLVLGLMGVLHALFVWYGDVLFIYAMVALVVMWFAGFGWRVLVACGVGCWVLAVAWMGVMMWLGTAFGGAGGEVLAADRAPLTFVEFREQLFDGAIQAGPMDPRWGEGEVDAFSNGPFSHAVGMRAINWASSLVFWVVVNGSGLHIAGMFFLGMGLMRSGVLTSERRRAWAVRFLAVGVVVGLPCSFAAVWFQERAMSGPEGMASLVFGAAAAGVLLVGPLVSIGYFGFAMWIADAAGRMLPVRMVASTGRMALTNYLGQSLVVAVLAQHWGLGWFGEVDRIGMVSIVVCVYGAQLVVSTLWLGVFTMGPLEWAWRLVTYWRVPRVLAVRASGGGASGGEGA